MPNTRIAFTCPQCGNTHIGLPALTYDSPSAFFGLSEKEQKLRAELTDDMCVIDKNDFFVRGCLEIPIIGESETLSWGVWGTLSQANFERYVNAFLDADQSKVGPMFSWFSNSLLGYPETLNLRSKLIPMNERMRPMIEFDPSQDHPLVRDQMNGVTLQQAVELALPVLHKY